ncbi:hypothetical protein NKR23_g4537 [Pleurostoma richardsiae]|uniref:Thioesterase domain-containing protein n=1 Tax=Pleurostoma richardsiae TaxID=41990 RepID=A0AA38VFN7_9PEZI|nr:hypothetical protein NKR23_g4537 [Pleurostoma richardsiae]
MAEKKTAEATTAEGNSMSEDFMSRLLSATPEDRVRLWLDSGALHDKNNPDSHDWMSALLPHLTLLSASPSGPHPSLAFAFTVQPQHCNRLGNLHGGCAATLFDYCTSLPLALVCRPGFWAFLGVSRTLAVTYLRPVPCGETVRVECEVVHLGRRLCSLKGTIRREGDGEGGGGGAVMATCEHGKFNTDPPPGKL